MNCKSVCVVLSAVLVITSAATYEFLPGIEYNGEVYVPLDVVASVRVARSPNSHRHGGHRGGHSQANADASASAGSEGLRGVGGSAAQANAKAEAGAEGFVFPGQFGGPGGPIGGPGGHIVAPGEPGGPVVGPIGGANANAEANAAAGAIGQGGGTPFIGGQPNHGIANAGASGAIADATSQSQQFGGQGWSASSSSSSAHASSIGGTPGVPNANVNANSFS